jgi:hypothetical protein
MMCPVRRKCRRERSAKYCTFLDGDAVQSQGVRDIGTTKLRMFWFRLIVHLRHLLNFVVLVHLGFNCTGIVSYFY